MNAPRRQQAIDPDALAALTVRSDRAGLLQLSLHLLALLLFGLLAMLSPQPLGLLSYIVYSVLLVFSFCAAHEAVHGSAFRSNWLNRSVAFAAGLILFLPPRYFESFHMAHHRFTQIVERDPELLMPRPATWISYLTHVSGIPYYLAQWRALMSNATGQVPDYVPARRQKGVVREARQFLLIYLLLGVSSLAMESMLLWWVWLLPGLIGQPFLRLFLLAEHSRCPEVADMFENTRTTLTNRLMRTLCWNMNYHTAHHAYAGVPFWQLPTVHGLIADHVRVKGDGYIAVNHEIMRELGAG